MRFIRDSTVPLGMPSFLATPDTFLGPLFPKASKMFTSRKSSLLRIYMSLLATLDSSSYSINLYGGNGLSIGSVSTFPEAIAVASKPS